MARKDGGPAFPSGGSEGASGISKRDYFAAMALAGLVDLIATNDAEAIANEAYIIANAMLERRDRP